MFQSSKDMLKYMISIEIPWICMFEIAEKEGREISQTATQQSTPINIYFNNIYRKFSTPIAVNLKFKSGRPIDI